MGTLNCFWAESFVTIKRKYTVRVFAINFLTPPDMKIAGG